MRKRSVELYRVHRDTHRPYLKAVSFLGAAAPEVKGLADPIFTESTPDTFTFTEDHTPDSAPDDVPSFADTMRERLMQTHRWRHAWQNQGLLDVFTALGPGTHSETLIAILCEEPPPVTFGAAEMIPSIDREDDLHAFIGEPSPESIQRHHRALSFLATHPAHSYAEALAVTSG